jgi:DNA-binding Lrp family transcriptional regulator
MKKIKLDMEKVVLVYNVLSKLRSYNGIDRKRVYWLDRNWDWLKPHIKAWFEKAQEIIRQYSVDTPQNPFIPLSKYPEFKKELMSVLSPLKTQEGVSVEISGVRMLDLEAVKVILEKYETYANFKSGIPVEKKEEYQNAIKEAMASMPEIEYEYMEIVADRVFDQVLQNLTGEEIMAIDFMLEEPSTVHVAQGTVLM